MIKKIPLWAVAVSGIIFVLLTAWITCIFGAYLNKNVNYYSTITLEGDVFVTDESDQCGEVVLPVDIPFAYLKGLTIFFDMENSADSEEEFHMKATLYVGDQPIQSREFSSGDMEEKLSLILRKSIAINDENVSLKVSGNGVGIAEIKQIEVNGSGKQHAALLFVFVIPLYFVLFLMLYNTLFYNKFESKNVADKCIIIFCIGICSIYCSQYYDISIISEITHQLTACIKEGELLNFYRYALDHSKFPLNANYNILQYLVVVLMVLPLSVIRRLHITIPDSYELVYLNIVLGLIFYFTGKFVKKLLFSWKVDDKTADAVTVAFYLNPILLFATVGFEQLDIICVLVALIALYFYSQDKMDAFALILSVAIAMKSLPVLMLFPLVLLKEKRLLHIARYCVEGVLASVIFHFVYGTSEAWRIIQSNHNFTGTLFINTFPSHNYSASLFCFCYILFCFCCYFHNSMKNWENILVSGMVVYTVFAMFVVWNPQYLTIYATFITLGFLIFPDRSKYFGILSFASLGYIGYTIMAWATNVDNYMFFHGVFELIYTKDAYAIMTLSSFVNTLTNFNYARELFLTIFVASAAFLAVTFLYYLRGKTKAENITNASFYRGYLYLPVMPLWVFIVLSLIINFSV